MYAGRVWLAYTEEQIWKLTPRQFAAQMRVHEYMLKQMYGSNPKAKMRPGSAAPMGFIDQIPGW